MAADYKKIRNNRKTDQTEQANQTEAHLDEEFVLVVRKVGALALRLKKPTIVAECTKWLNRFAAASEQEKLARNALAQLLHDQLSHTGQLCQAPFNVERNIHRDLRLLNNNRKEKVTTSPSVPLPQAEYIDEAHEDGEAAATTLHTSETLEWLPNGVGESASNTMDCGVCFYMRLEDANKQLHEDNCTRQQRLAKLNDNYAKLHAQKLNLQQVCQMLQREHQSHAKELCDFKRTCVNSARFAVAKLSQNEAFFTILFRALKYDADKFKDSIDLLNEQFAGVLGKSIDDYLLLQKKQLLVKLSNDYDALKQQICSKYTNVLELQRVADAKLLTLSEMRYYTVLRKIYIDTYHANENEKVRILNLLKEKYEKVAAEL